MVGFYEKNCPQQKKYFEFIVLCCCCSQFYVKFINLSVFSVDAITFVYENVRDIEVI